MYTVIGSLVAAIAIFFGGFYVGRGQKEIQIQEKIVEIKGETLTVYKDRIITVTKKVYPDGRTEETTRTEEKEGKTESKDSSTAKDKNKKELPLLSNYSIGGRYWGDYNTLWKNPSWSAVEVNVGRRVFGDVWGDVGIRKKAASVGFRFQF